MTNENLIIVVEERFAVNLAESHKKGPRVLPTGARPGEEEPVKALSQGSLPRAAVIKLQASLWIDPVEGTLRSQILGPLSLLPPNSSSLPNHWVSCPVCARAQDGSGYAWSDS